VQGAAVELQVVYRHGRSLPVPRSTIDG
jgi:hypothetical protein